MAARHVNPNQLRMFMTPKEIVDTYQVLDGDREGAPRAGSYTRRSATTGGRPNMALHSNVRQNLNLGPSTHVRDYNEETDEQVWERKGWESRMDPHEYFTHRHGMSPGEAAMPRESFLFGGSSAPQPPSGSSGWTAHEHAAEAHVERKYAEHHEAMEARFSGPSIWQSVRQEGVKEPVHLGNVFGSVGKRQIVGGHHRIAAALETRPSDYIPVLHHEDITAAKADPRYT
jgi:hypothetical protein